MKAKILLFSILLIASPLVYCHDGHNHEGGEQKIESSINQESEPQKESLIDTVHWLGNFHTIFLHFPIALIVMTVVSELLFLFYDTPLFSQASRFMIIAAAITSVPTVFFGLAYGYDADYEGIHISYFWWHRLLGVFTMFFAIAAAIFKELYFRKSWNTAKMYYICLLLIFISVSITAFLGGEMTFGIGQLF